jgi:hypothetical protein
MNNKYFVAAFIFEGTSLCGYSDLMKQPSHSPWKGIGYCIRSGSPKERKF